MSSAWTVNFGSKKPSEYKMELENGFIAKTSNKEYLEKHDLLGKGTLHFVNTLCILVDEKKDELPVEEWKSLELTLCRLMVDYDYGELYYYLLHSYGVDAINYNAWVHFSLDTDWNICLRAFTDMPTEVLEEYGLRDWHRRSPTAGDGKEILKAISRRSDIYGANSGLPPEMVKGILFDSSPNSR
jgi:hypothetical protein